MSSHTYSFLSAGMHPSISGVAGELRRVAVQHALVFELEQVTAPPPQNALVFCLTLIAAFDHCFFALATRSGLWMEHELENARTGFFADSAHSKLSGTPMRCVLKPLGFDASGRRMQWVDALKSLRNCMVHRTAVFLKKDLDAMEAHLGAVAVPAGFDKRTVVVTLFLKDMADRLCELAAVVDMVAP